jgi:hypothetical protein
MNCYFIIGFRPFFLLSLNPRDEPIPRRPKPPEEPRSWDTRHTGSTDSHSRHKELSSLLTRHAVEGLSQHTINGGGDGGGGDGGWDGSISPIVSLNGRHGQRTRDHKIPAVA